MSFVCEYLTCSRLRPSVFLQSCRTEASLLQSSRSDSLTKEGSLPKANLIFEEPTTRNIFGFRRLGLAPEGRRLSVAVQLSTRNIFGFRRVGLAPEGRRLSVAVQLKEPASNGEGDLTMEDPRGQGPEGAIELEDASAFVNVADEMGLVSICGFGSLLSEKSARYTFPNLLNFRVAVLPGFRRVFAHVAPVFLERGIANVATKEMSSLSVEPSPGESIIVTVFEIPISEVPAFIEREHEFRFLAVTLQSLQGEPSSTKAVICARYSDKEYRQHRCQDDEEYHRRYGRYNIEQIWRDDILPCRVYLRHCVLAAKNLSQVAYVSFLDHTYLGDRIITIRQHLAANEQIMQEKPPLSLQERYGG